MADNDTYLIVGLGNPGAEYARHRHNVGFMAIDALASAWHAKAFTKKFQSDLTETRVKNCKLLLLKPQTYMNNSGRAVLAAKQFYKIKLEHLIVIQDEIDLAPGKLRIKKGGGANGQNGIRDIDKAIGNEYWRIRLGVGRPQHGEVHGHVLSDFGKDERATIDQMLEALATHFPLMFTHSPEGLMSKVSDIMSPPRPKAAKPVDKADASA